MPVDGYIVKYLRVKKDGATLYLGLEPGSYSNGSLRVPVTVPRLSSVRLSGGSRGSLAEPVSGERFQVNLSGGNRWDGVLAVDEARLEISGGSEITLRGTAGRLVVTASGGGKANLTDGDPVLGRREVSGGGSLVRR